MITADKKAMNVRSAVYAAGHFLVDFLCASMMYRLLPGIWYFFFYNFFAFAVQMPIGLLADMLGKNHRFSMLGVLLIMGSVCPIAVPLRILFAGLGNACYHVGGGRDALLADKKMTRLGLFVSPGALGICFGTLFSGNVSLYYFFAVIFLVCGALICKFCRDEMPVSTVSGHIRLSTALLMTLVVILRSVLGLSMESPWKTGLFIVFSGVASAMGKFIGGVLADRFGGKAVGVTTLLISAALFCLPNNAIAGVMGVLIFNMTMPITLRRASDVMPGMEGFSFGLLTFGLFLGFVPSFFGVVIPWWGGAMLSVAAAALMLADKE